MLSKKSRPTYNTGTSPNEIEAGKGECRLGEGIFLSDKKLNLTFFPPVYLF